MFFFSLSLLNFLSFLNSTKDFGKKRKRPNERKKAFLDLLLLIFLPKNRKKYTILFSLIYTIEQNYSPLISLFFFFLSLSLSLHITSAIDSAPFLWHQHAKNGKILRESFKKESKGKKRTIEGKASSTPLCYCCPLPFKIYKNVIDVYIYI